MKTVWPIGAAAVLAIAAGASANIVSPSIDFSDPGDSATTTFTAFGSGSMTASGTVYVKILAWWVPINVNFSNSNITLGANPDTIAWSSDPTGTGQVEFERVSQPLDSGKLDALNVDLKGGSAWNYSLDRIELSEQAGLSKFYIDTAGSVSAFRFDMTGAPTGTYNAGSEPVVTYDISPSGVLTTSYSATMNGSLSVGITFLGNWYAFDIPVGTFFSGSGTIALPATANGTMTLTELAGAYPRDVKVAIDASVGPVSIPFSLNDDFVINKAMSGNNPYYTLTGHYDLNGLLKGGSTHMALTDTVQGIIPEPMTVSLLAVGGSMWAFRRRREK